MTENQRKTGNNRVYSRMLRDYRAAADKLLVRQNALKTELRQLAAFGVQPDHARELEKRIRMLREEYEDMVDAMDSIRFYADKEARC